MILRLHIFLTQLRYEIEPAKRELKRETHEIYNQMITEINSAATQVLKRNALQSFQGARDQSGREPIASQDQSPEKSKPEPCPEQEQDEREE